MLISTVLSTLLCALLVDARLAPVNSAEALALCMKQPNCYSPALEINPTTFFPVIKASPPVEVRLNIAIKSNQPLTFLVHAENTPVRWEITRPSDTCLWEISSDAKGAVTFREISGSRVNLYQLFVGYNVDLGSDVNISVRREGTDNFVDVTGNFNNSPLPGKLSACAYAQPDSDLIPDWDIWTISVSASETSDPRAHIAFSVVVLVTIMLILTVFLTLLCSSLADARKALVDSSEALTRCLNQPYCNNAALDIDETTFQPTVKASPHGVVVLNLAVKSNRPLTFPVHVENYSVTWKITRPGDKCIWKITSEGIGAVVFKEIPGSPTELPLFCNVAVGGDVNISVRTEGTDNYVDFTGECDTKPSPGKLSACAYARPDSDSIPGWDIWTISVSATTSDPRASIALRDAYVVHDAPEPQAAPQCGTACLECVRSMLTPNSN